MTNREIKFRAWDRVRRTWVYFYMLAGEQPVPLYDGSFLWRDLEPWQQYTGLEDKDGKECYESDIVLVDGRRTICVWRDGEAGFGFQWETDEHHFYCMDYLKDGEIIGDIYSNPDLLHD